MGVFKQPRHEVYHNLRIDIAFPSRPASKVLDVRHGHDRNGLVWHKEGRNGRKRILKWRLF